MKKIHSLSLLCLLALLVIACEIPQKQGGNQLPRLNEEVVGNLFEGLGNLSTEVQELARPGKVQAWVSNLIIKVQPGKDMPQIGTLKEGEVADYLYQRTVRKTEFILRGQRYYEPWILIRTKEGLMGWVHEGGVKFMGPDLENILGLNPTTPSTPGDPAARMRGPQANPASPLNFVVVPGKSVGPIKLTTTETDLIQLYGAANVGRSTVVLPTKQQETCTVVMAGTKDELRITWKSEKRDQVKAVYFDRSGSRWYTKQGLGVGLPLSELTKANKAPISFLGLNWEYGGTVESWQKGALNPYKNYFYVVLSPSSQAPPAKTKQYSGNQTFSSNAEDVGELGLQVSRMVVYLD